MNIYIDESGSINNKLSSKDKFIIALVNVFDIDALRKSHKRFISKYYDRLRELDQPKISKGGKILKPGKKMFSSKGFKELKGSSFDKQMKLDFANFFAQKPSFEVYYICVDNAKLDDIFCENTSKTFNYAVKNALQYFISRGFLPKEDCILHIDERNEKSFLKHHLEEYLNTELRFNGTTDGEFTVIYYNSIENRLVQVADVFANLYYSNFFHGDYDNCLEKLRNNGIIKAEYHFPYK